MTLAVILVSISLAGSAAPLPEAVVSQDAAQAAPSSKPATADNPQDQASTPPAHNPSVVSKPGSPTSRVAQSPSTQNPPPAKRPPHKRKVTPSNCTPAPAAASDPTAGSAPSNSEPPKASAGGSTSKAGAASATDCPPSKIIVRHGGTSEPAIQLAGGPVGDQAAQQRNTANQMLAATQLNLKKIAGRTLTANQEDMVKQVHQFMEQSKAATATGDIDRARTLAWKAQLLSEELTKPLK